MNIRVVEPTATSEWRWVVVCPGISKETNTEVNAWLDQQKITYSNVVATYWFPNRKDVDWFILRWS